MDRRARHPRGGYCGGVRSECRRQYLPRRLLQTHRKRSQEHEDRSRFRPEAQLLSIRVFGCQGSSNVVMQGLDRALDPNEDGDFSDRANIINLSLRQRIFSG